MVRILAKRVCPVLPDRARACDILDRILKAAEILKHRFRKLTGEELDTVDQCIFDVQMRRKHLIDNAG